MRRRSSSGGRKSGGILSGGIGGFLGGRGGHRTAVVIGSAALGYAQKEGWLAKLPVVGKAGPITSFGLLGWGAEEFLKMKLPPLVGDMITAALALSAFNIGFSGGTTIVGASTKRPAARCSSTDHLAHFGAELRALVTHEPHANNGKGR